MYVSWAAVVLSSFFWDRVGCNELFLFGFGCHQRNHESVEEVLFCVFWVSCGCIGLVMAMVAMVA